MAARENILARLRAHSPLSPTPAVTSALLPAMGRTSGETAIKQFVAKAKATHATVERVDGWLNAPTAVRAYLNHEKISTSSVVTADDPRLALLSWDFTLKPAAPDIGDMVGLSIADAGIAEIGTLFFMSGKGFPATLHFVPETEIVLVPSVRILPSLEGIWAMLRDRDLPRAGNFVTGPSRTADIELSLTMGAHGPRRLHIIVIDGD